jgi:dephospho-CoA kinase
MFMILAHWRRLNTSLIKRIGDTDRIGLTGRAGSGKTTMAQFVSRFQGGKIITLDDYFYETSEQRKARLSSGKDYARVANQLNWWDYERLIVDLDRSTRFVLEGAILGNSGVLDRLQMVLVLCCDPKVRLQRLKIRDQHKRTLAEIEKRFELTQKSEDYYYGFLKKYRKVIYIDKHLEVVDESYFS